MSEEKASSQEAIEAWFPKEPSALLETPRAGFWVPVSTAARWGCSSAGPPGIPRRETERSWPLGIPQAISITLGFFPVRFWRNERWYEPGKCFSCVALSSDGLLTSRGLEGKSHRISQAGVTEVDTF